MTFPRLVLGFSILFLFPGCVFLEEEKYQNSALIGIIVINELSTNKDLEDDWIELFNKESGPANLSGFYLSDDDIHIAKWSFPEGTVISGRSFLVVTCNGDNIGLSTNFSLKPGERLTLTTPDGGTIIDEFEHVPDTGEGSIGYERDGEGSMVYFEYGSKGASNEP